jgi:proteic killer suppression protein
MIRSFADRATERLFRDDACPAQWREFKAVAVRKLDVVDAATKLEDLRSPPGSRLEALKGDRKGQWSIRSIGNGGSVFGGRRMDRLMSKSWIITEAYHGSLANPSRRSAA